MNLAARYQNELAGVEAEQLAERFYHQALSVSPHVGKWAVKMSLGWSDDGQERPFPYICHRLSFEDL